MSQECALRIAAAFGDPPEFWYKLANDYALPHVLEKDKEALTLAAEVGQMCRCIPDLKEAASHGWIPKDAAIKEQAKAALRLLCLPSLTGPDLTVYAGSALPAVHRDLLRVNAWWRFAQTRADKLSVQPFSAQKLHKIVRDDILGEDWSRLDVEKMQSLLAPAGVRLVVASPPKKLNLAGAAQAAVPATIVLSKDWNELKDASSLLLQLVSLLLTDKSENIWLWSEKLKAPSRPSVEEQAIELAKKLDDLDFKIRWFDSESERLREKEDFDL